MFLLPGLAPARHCTASGPALLSRAVPGDDSEGSGGCPPPFVVRGGFHSSPGRDRHCHSRWRVSGVGGRRAPTLRVARSGSRSRGPRVACPVCRRCYRDDGRFPVSCARGGLASLSDAANPRVRPRASALSRVRFTWWRLGRARPTNEDILEQ